MPDPFTNPSAQIKAIETNYGGSKFRSRLEARWAVFFTNLGIDWVYEPEGFHVSGPRGEEAWYLPDFFLPDLCTWVEVKGRMSPRDLTTVCWAVLPYAKHLPADLYNPENTSDPSVLVLGDVPATGNMEAYHALLSFHHGDVTETRHPFTITEHDGNQIDPLPMEAPRPIYSDAGVWRVPNVRTYAREVTQAVMHDYMLGFSVAIDAYAAARGARFEHGRKG